jgi:23S rRNA (uracil1939-C5)-methyltransferase
MQVKFHGLATGGDAVGRDESGRVVFAPLAAPGEECEVEVLEEKKSFARARVLQVLAPSVERTEPRCPYFGRCGGSQWQHIEYAAQLKWKREIVVEALGRVFGREEIESLAGECAPSPPYGYRNKAEWTVARGADGAAQIGFFARHSHDIVDIEVCPQQPEILQQVLAAAREAFARELVLPFDVVSGRGVLKRLLARVDTQNNVAIVAETSRDKWSGEKEWARWMAEQVPPTVGILRREPRAPARTLFGRGWLEERVEGLSLRVDAEGFFQVNPHLSPALVRSVRRHAQVQAGQRALDVFCGVGLFALDLARSGAQVLGLEIDRNAVRRAQGNALALARAAEKEGAAVGKAEFQSGDAGAALQVLARSGAKFDVAVLDPPREGARECVPALKAMAPERIVYVSCDPQTLARDLGELREMYHLRAIEIFDLFPQTAHVEVVAALEKRWR